MYQSIGLQAPAPDDTADDQFIVVEPRLLHHHVRSVVAPVDALGHGRAQRADEVGRFLGRGGIVDPGGGGEEVRHEAKEGFLDVGYPFGGLDGVEVLDDGVRGGDALGLDGADDGFAERIHLLGGRQHKQHKVGRLASVEYCQHAPSQHEPLDLLFEPVYPTNLQISIDWGGGEKEASRLPGREDPSLRAVGLNVQTLQEHPYGGRAA